VLRMRVMTSTVGGNLTNRPPALRHIHVNNKNDYEQPKGNKFIKIFQDFWEVCCAAG